MISKCHFRVLSCSLAVVAASLHAGCGCHSIVSTPHEVKYDPASFPAFSFQAPVVDGRSVVAHFRSPQVFQAHIMIWIPSGTQGNEEIRAEMARDTSLVFIAVYDAASGLPVSVANAPIASCKLMDQGRERAMWHADSQAVHLQAQHEYLVICHLPLGFDRKYGFNPVLELYGGGNEGP